MNQPNAAAAAAATPANKPKRGRPAGADAKVWDYTGLDAAMLGAPVDVSAELASMAAPTRARDERQVQIDKIVAGLHARWIAANRPDKWAAMPKQAYHVPPKSADTVRMLVRRAASFHGVSAKFGKAVRDQQGREIVVFAIRDSRKRSVKTENDTFTIEDLREFLSDFYGESENGAEEIENFLAAFVGEDETDESEENGE